MAKIKVTGSLFYECQECGNEIELGDNFCKECGESILWYEHYGERAIDEQKRNN